MSKNSRRKRATRPWQDANALRDLGAFLPPTDVDEDLEIDGYVVKDVPAGRAEKDYVCPDCGNQVPQGEAHVVVWPEDDPDLRRHWHRHCWRMEVRAGGDGR